VLHRHTDLRCCRDCGLLLPPRGSAESRHHPPPLCTFVQGKTAASVNQSLQELCQQCSRLRPGHPPAAAALALTLRYGGSLHCLISPGLRLSPMPAKSLQCLALLSREPDPSYPCLCGLGHGCKCTLTLPVNSIGHLISTLPLALQGRSPMQRILNGLSQFFCT